MKPLDQTITELQGMADMDAFFSYTPLLAETALEDKAVQLAYLFGKAKRKLNRLESGAFAPTQREVEITRAAVERIRRACCRNAMRIHEKYYKP